MDYSSRNTYSDTLPDAPRSLTHKRKRAAETDDLQRSNAQQPAGSEQPRRSSGMLATIPEMCWNFGANMFTGFFDLFRTRQAPAPQQTAPQRTHIAGVATDLTGRKRRAVDVTSTPTPARLSESQTHHMSKTRSPVAVQAPAEFTIPYDRNSDKEVARRARWHREYYGPANADRMRPKQQPQQPTLPSYKPTTHTKAIPFRERQVSGLIARAHKAQGGSFAQKAAQKAAEKEAAAREAAEKAAAEKAAAEEAARIEAEKEAERIRAEEEAARAKEVIVQLPEVILDKLQKCMAGPQKDRDTLVQLGSIPIQKISFRRILASDKGTESWLDDDAVNAWYNSIVDAAKRQDGYVKSDTKPPKFANLQTAWFDKATKDGPKALKRWMKRAGVGGATILDCERIFLPINMGSHWTLLIINGKDRSIEYLDSLGGGGDKYFKLARELLKSELGDKYHEQQWTNLARNRSSRQDNMSDCGVFTCINGLAAAKDRPYKEVTAEKMPLARKMIVGVFLNGGFEGELEL